MIISPEKYVKTELLSRIKLMNVVYYKVLTNKCSQIKDFLQQP